MICFLSIGAADQTLCFKSDVPLQYEDMKHCSLDKNKIIDYMHKDLVNRQVTILFKCTETNQIKL